jgi:opacity protein-like surface antigen
MQTFIRGFLFTAAAAVAFMPVGRADRISSFGQQPVPGGVDPADEAWEQAGLCSVAATLPEADGACDSPSIDLCGCEPAANGNHTDAACAEACGEVRGCDDPAAGCCGGLGGDEHASRRGYITGIIGASFGTLQSGGTNTEGNFPNTGRVNDSLLTAGGAIGMAFDRSAGLLRLEVEGRGRDALSGLTNSFEPPSPTYFYSVRAADGWSVMTNAWRDWYLTERLGVYGGGGIGAGGYRLTVDDSVVSGYGHVGGFAWQVGTGTTFQLTQRTTLDLGYRFFDTVSDSLPLTVNGSGGVPAGSYVSNFYASELLLSVRIYEPFRSRPSR